MFNVRRYILLCPHGYRSLHCILITTSIDITANLYINFVENETTVTILSLDKVENMYSVSDSRFLHVFEAITRIGNPILCHKERR